MLDSHFRKEEFKKSVKENVKMLYRKTLDEASQEQIFQAVSLAVKDVVIDNWLLTQKQYEKDDPQFVFACLFLLHYFQRSFVFPLLMRGKSRMPVAIVNS